MNQQEIIERLTAQLVVKRDTDTEIKYLINELVRILTPNTTKSDNDALLDFG